MKNKLCPFLAAGVLRGGNYDPGELAVVAQCLGDRCMLWHPGGTSATPRGRCAIWATAFSLARLEAHQR
jgi:hypothetical protein